MQTDRRMYLPPFIFLRDLCYRINYELRLLILIPQHMEERVYLNEIRYELLG